MMAQCENFVLLFYKHTNLYYIYKLLMEGAVFLTNGREGSTQAVIEFSQLNHNKPTDFI